MQPDANNSGNGGLTNFCNSFKSFVAFYESPWESYYN